MSVGRCVIEDDDFVWTFGGKNTLGAPTPLSFGVSHCTWCNGLRVIVMQLSIDLTVDCKDT